MTWKQSLLGVSSLALFAFVACETSATTFDDAPVLAHEVDDVMMPTLQALDANAATLVTATTTLQSAVNEANLEAAQAAWRAVRASWEETAAFRFGPSEAGPPSTESITQAIDTYPVDSVSLETIVAATDAITPTVVDAVAPNEKGFFALEYLLFNPNGNPAVLTQFTSSSRYADYLVGAATSLKSNTAKLLTAWSPSGGNYAGQIKNAGPSSTSYSSGKAAIDQIVNQSANALEIVVNTDLGTPLGKENNGTPQPSSEQTLRSDNTENDIVSILTGVQNVYQGFMPGSTSVPGNGIVDVLKSKNASLATEYSSDLTDAVAKASAIPHTFQSALTSDPAAVEAAYDSAKTAKDTLATDCSSALGTTINFADSDGD